MECKRSRRRRYIAPIVVTLTLLSLFGGLICFVASHALYVKAAKAGLGDETPFIVNMLDVCGGMLLTVALLSFILHAFVRGIR